MPGLEQAVAWLQEPYNRTALAMVQIAGGVLVLALIAGLASALHNWRRRRRLRRQSQATLQPLTDSPAEGTETQGQDAQSQEANAAPKAAYAAILRLTPNDARARKGAGR